MDNKANMIEINTLKAISAVGIADYHRVMQRQVLDII